MNASERLAVETAQTALKDASRTYSIIEFRHERGLQYIATHPTRPGRFRIKAAFPEFAPETKNEELKVVRAEVESLEKINHKNVIKFYDSFVTETGGIWIIMDDFEGALTLDSFVRVYGAKLTETDYHNISRQFFAGLSGTHEAGFVHRDISPGNVTLRKEENGALEVRIVDFGIATKEGKTLTHTLGTPGYIAPECKSGTKATAPSDVYSAGVLVQRLLSGTFSEETPSLNGDKQSIAPKTLHKIPEAYRSSFAAILNRCIKENPEERYRDARSVLFDLELITRKREITALEKLIENDSVQGLAPIAKAYSLLYDKSQQEQVTDSELLKKANTAFSGLKRKLSLEALAPNERMELKKIKNDTAEKFARDALLKTALNITSSELAKYAPQIRAKDIAQDWSSLPQEAHFVWNTFRTIGLLTPLDKLIEKVQETAEYERVHSAEELTRKGQDLLEKAKAAKNSTRYPAIEELFLGALADDPAYEAALKGLEEAQLKIAHSLLDTSPKAAKEKIKSILMRGPPRTYKTAIYYELSRAESRLKNHKASLDAYDTGLKNEDELTIWGLSHRSELVKKAYAQSPDTCQQEIRNMTPDIIKAYERALKPSQQSPPLGTDEHVLAARAYQSEDKIEKEIACWVRALAEDPGNFALQTGIWGPINRKLFGNANIENEKREPLSVPLQKSTSTRWPFWVAGSLIAGTILSQVIAYFSFPSVRAKYQENVKQVIEYIKN